MFTAEIDLKCGTANCELERGRTLVRFTHITKDLDDYLTRHAHPLIVPRAYLPEEAALCLGRSISSFLCTSAYGFHKSSRISEHPPRRMSEARAGRPGGAQKKVMLDGEPIRSMMPGAGRMAALMTSAADLQLRVAT
jgi:hypothetical protein